VTGGDTRGLRQSTRKTRQRGPDRRVTRRDHTDTPTVPRPWVVLKIQVKPVLSPAETLKNEPFPALPSRLRGSTVQSAVRLAAVSLASTPD
jgi:hypothetical protein